MRKAIARQQVYPREKKRKGTGAEIIDNCLKAHPLLWLKMYLLMLEQVDMNNFLEAW